MLGIFLDIETTGLAPTVHRVLELAFKVVHLDSGEVRASCHRVVAQSDEVWAERDRNSIEVNGFTLEKMQSGISESDLKAEIISIFQELKIKRGKAVFICQNPSFDRAFFSQLVPTYEQEGFEWPYHWLDLASMFWVTQVHARKNERGFSYSSIPLSKDGIARTYKLPPEEKPHLAMNGVDHLLLCFQTIMTRKAP